MANIDQHLAYFDAIVVTFNVSYHFKAIFTAKKGVMVVVSTAIVARLYVQPSPMKKNTLDSYQHLQYAPSKRDAFLLHQKPLLVF
jgi:hypothetical protein